MNKYRKRRTRGRKGYALCSLPEHIEIKKNLIFVKTNKNGEIKKAGDPKRAHVVCLKSCGLLRALFKFWNCLASLLLCWQGHCSKLANCPSLSRRRSINCCLFCLLLN